MHRTVHRPQTPQALESAPIRERKKARMRERTKVSEKVNKTEGSHPGPEGCELVCPPPLPRGGLQYLQAAKLELVEGIRFNTSMASSLCSYHVLNGSWKAILQDLEQVRHPMRHMQPHHLLMRFDCTWGW